MITYQYCGGRLGENISFIYGLFKFCKNNNIDFKNIKINIDYKSTSFVNDKDGEYVFKNNITMFKNIRYVFENKEYFHVNFEYVDLENKNDLASFYDFYKYNPQYIDKNLCFCNWWSLDKYWITKDFDFDFELLKYICFPENVVKKIQKTYKKILHNSLGIHIRRGDFLSLENKEILKDEILNNFNHYFSNKQIYTEDDIHKMIVDNYSTYDNILIFSDDIQWCEKTFGMYKHVNFIRNRYPYEDMILMSICKKLIFNKGSYFSRIPYIVNFYNSHEKTHS